MQKAEEIHEKYKDFICYIADYLSKVGLEYDDAYNQCYLFLYENSLIYTSEIDIKKHTKSDMQKYYRHEIKESNYGLDPYVLIDSKKYKERRLIGDHPENHLG